LPRRNPNLIEHEIERWIVNFDLRDCRTLALARAVFAVAVEQKPAGRFTIRSRTRVVKRHPEGDW
jgi:hypothetical protein